MGHCIISGNSDRTSVVGLLKITNQFYIGDPVVSIFVVNRVYCIGVRERICLSLYFTFHLTISGLDHLCSLSLLHACQYV